MYQFRALPLPSNKPCSLKKLPKKPLTIAQSPTLNLEDRLTKRREFDQMIKEKEAMKEAHKL